MSSADESVISVDLAGERLLGILHRPAGAPRSLLIIVVGGPQYRVGSHRQFVLLARALAAAGHAVIRFDYRGMGDSSGRARTFEEVDEDLRAVIDWGMQALPHSLRISLLGLCDAASAIAMYAAHDSRISALILLNPWARTVKSEAAVYMKHYYGKRLFAADLWRKVLRGEFNPRRAAREFIATWRQSRQRSSAASRDDFRARMTTGLHQFRGEVLLLMSGRDLTAREFDDFCAATPALRARLQHASVTRVDFTSADHTFSERADLNACNLAIATWLSRAS